MVLTWTFSAGILFELPVVVYFLAMLGIVTAALMRRIRKFAFLGILILAALFTPPDPLSQVIMAVPMVGLYEGAIWLAAFVERRRNRQLAAENAALEAREAANSASRQHSTDRAQ
jgi:sec-independent protein translocase protein TatC